MDELAKRMMELAEKVGPDAMAAARGAVKVEAYSCMVSGVVCLLVGIILFYAANYLWGYQPVDRFDAGVPKFLGGLVAAIALIVCICGVWSFIDPWTWTAISHPDLWLAKKVLKL